MGPLSRHYERHFFQTEAPETAPFVSRYQVLVAAADGTIAPEPWVQLNGAWPLREQALAHAQRAAQFAIDCLLYREAIAHTRAAKEDYAQAIDRSIAAMNAAQATLRRASDNAARIAARLHDHADDDTPEG